MQIESIRLNHFRNYAEMQLHPDAGLNVLTGENAAGKTNLLEAVFLCALGRSHRTSRDGELIRAGQPMGGVRVGLTARGGSRTIECRMAQGERKRLLIDGAPLMRSGELLGCLNVVLFAPEDLALVKGGPGERRRFLDMEISQLRPAYYYTLQRYNHALKQRNALLRETPAASPELIGLWDEQLARLGADIMRARAAFTADVAELAQTLHGRLSGGQETLRVTYQPSVTADDPDALAPALSGLLAAHLERDIARGSTSVGPHRDDVALTLDGADVRAFGSQGQQRTAVLSLKLAELDLMKRALGESPVLLLDDVFSELDRSRQRMLLEAVAGCQTFITCTHIEPLAEAGAARMRVYRVQNGTVAG